MEEAKKMKCYKRLIYKQFVQVSGLCGPQFLSYLPKRFTHLCRALYRDAILVYRFGAPIWPPEINKNIWSSLFLWKLFLFTRELAYVRINISSNTWNGYTADNQEERLFFKSFTWKIPNIFRGYLSVKETLVVSFNDDVFSKSGS